VDGKDITLRQLITHTAGFGNITFHISTDEDLEYPLSAEEIRSRRPPIVRKPGGRFVNSNYSTTMIGVIPHFMLFHGMTTNNAILQRLVLPLIPL
jgi:CubicO group peptidase (beta-lactamase class C family)